MTEIDRCPHEFDESTGQCRQCGAHYTTIIERYWNELLAAQLAADTAAAYIAHAERELAELRALVARLIRGGRTMPDEPLLRQQARVAIRAGKLPTRHSDRMFGAPGSEQPCAVCGKTLPRAKMEIELEFNRHGATPGIDRFHFHDRCYAAWEFERTKGG